MAERVAERRVKRERRRRKYCIFCAEKRSLDYKDAEFLKKFMSDRAKIMPRRGTGCCAKHQRMLAAAIKRARHLGLVPYTVD